ncbi:MAG: AraC family transcriptional regulator [Lachnospiraceae bacterium]|nr:AraC family transcriptional regulator [Lachnospiraceae bacterium]
MHVSVAIANQHFRDINPRVCGWEDCEPSHKYGPAARDYWLIHYVLEGEGVFKVGDQQYPVHASQMFVIRPDELTYYEADEKTPWKYTWIGFDCGITVPQALTEHVITLPQGRPLFELLRKAESMTAGREVYLCGKIWELMYLVSSNQKGVGRKELYIRQAKNFIESEYMVGITVGEVAARLGLDRSYLSNLFKQTEGKSPQQYLNEVRMRQAAVQLMELGYTVTETAASVGYADVFAFSRMFKQYYGVAPSEYRSRTNS